MSLTTQEEEQLGPLNKAVRIGAQCAAFLQSEAVGEFFDVLDRTLVDAAMGLPKGSDADDERYRTLAAADVARKLRAWMQRAAEQREYNEKQLEALYRKQDAD